MRITLPLEMLQVMIEGAEQVQGAANGFGELLTCTIRVAPEHEGDPALLLSYARERRDWTIEFPLNENVGDKNVTP
jgi:hypothetical protein